ncbi:hypothetical protein AYO21_11150 [Fonsecaea monophora]|uniref:Uncharacterized protein n=1 Tax=Fonsecaea monophora TaxID=254056 RepID=A0A177ETB5_9EURO|nr:hypothetical protein AYO21_11150 [Fonsecaea monophora]KAH0847415.1 hypothetical protein FOPE_00606 [Fonsecaea pedrosoi]OAG34671.1 hypothetical protein AYO21_11150 [Fonsecaea monophora]
MAAIPSFAFPDMDVSQLDDKMDVASSPFRQPDDIDIDLDSVREPSVIGSPHDDMVDDPVAPLDTELDVMEDQFDETLPDDDMKDEQNTSMLTEQPDLDYNMDGSIEEVQGDEDEDILYEDEEDITAAVQDVEVVDEYNEPEAQPQPFQEVEADVISEETGERFEQENHADIDTNQDKGLTDVARASLPAQDAAQEQGEIHAPHIEIPNTSTEYVAGQDGENQATEQTQAEQHDDGDELLEQRPEAEAEAEAEPETETDTLPHETVSGPETDVQTRTETSEPAPHDQYEETAKNEAGSAALSVHPVTLVYLEEEMSLFPPMLGDASSVYFLPDASLAFEPLDKLLAACREILTGTLDHHDELVLDVPGLGLHICEDSKYATQITLSQILDVYLHLCNNNGGEVIQPLYCHLSSRVSLASQYAYLCSAGAEGKTYAEIAADHSESPEVDGDGAEESIEDGQDEGDHSPTKEEIEAVTERTDIQALTAADDTDTLDQKEPAEDEIFSDHATRDSVPTASDADHPEAFAATAEPEATEQAALLADADQEDGEPEDVYDETREPEASGTERELRPDTQDQPGDDEEHETNSSHTVEGDVAETDFENIEDATREAEDSGQPAEEAEDLFRHEEDGAEPESSYKSYGDQEFLVAQDEFGDGVPEDITAIKQNQDQVATLPATDDTDASLLPKNTEIVDEDSSHQASAAENVDLGNLSPPMTPVKGKQAKRKAEEDDELFLDLDTPDPKRRRPS